MFAVLAMAFAGIAVVDDSDAAPIANVTGVSGTGITDVDTSTTTAVTANMKLAIGDTVTITLTCADGEDAPTVASGTTGVATVGGATAPAGGTCTFTITGVAAGTSTVTVNTNVVTISVTVGTAGVSQADPQELSSVQVGDGSEYKLYRNTAITGDLTILAGGKVSFQTVGVTPIYVTIKSGATVELEGDSGKQSGIALNGGILVIESGVEFNVGENVTIGNYSVADDTFRLGTNSPFCGIVLERGAILNVSDGAKINVPVYASNSGNYGTEIKNIGVGDGYLSYSSLSIMLADGDYTVGCVSQTITKFIDANDKSKYSNVNVLTLDGTVSTGVLTATSRINDFDIDDDNGTADAQPVDAPYVLVDESASFTISENAILAINNGTVLVKGTMGIEGKLASEAVIAETYGAWPANVASAVQGGTNYEITSDNTSFTFGTNTGTAASVINAAYIYMNGVRQVPTTTTAADGGNPLTLVLGTAAAPATALAATVLVTDVVNNNAALKVTGEVTINNANKIYGGKISATIYYEGTASAPGADADITYTNFPNAIASIGTNKSTVLVYGKVDVARNITIPAVANVRLIDDANFTINKGVTVDIEKNGTLQNTKSVDTYNGDMATVTVKGTLSAAAANGIRLTNAEIFNYDAYYQNSDKSVVYTTLENMVANVADNAKPALRGTWNTNVPGGAAYVLLINSDITIDKKLNLNVANIRIDDGVTLTIGSDADFAVAQYRAYGDANSKFAVNGSLILTGAPTTYCVDGDFVNPYPATHDNVDGMLVGNYSTTGSNTYKGFARAVEDGNGVLIVSGKVTVGSVEFDGTSVTVPAGAELVATQITMKSGDIHIANEDYLVTGAAAPYDIVTPNEAKFSADRVVLNPDTSIYSDAGKFAKVNATVTDGQGNSVKLTDAANFNVAGEETSEISESGSETKTYNLDLTAGGSYGRIETTEGKIQTTGEIYPGYAYSANTTDGIVLTDSVDSNSKVTIGSGSTLDLSDNGGTLRNVVVNGTITLGSKTLTVKDKVVNNGTINGETGKIVLADTTVSTGTGSYTGVPRTAGNTDAGVAFPALFVIGTNPAVKDAVSANGTVNVQQITTNGGIVAVFNGSTLNVDKDYAFPDNQTYRMMLNGVLILTEYGSSSTLVWFPVVKTEYGTVTKILDKDGEEYTKADTGDYELAGNTVINHQIRISGETGDLTVDTKVNTLYINFIPGVTGIMIDGETIGINEGQATKFLATGTHSVQVFTSVDYEGTISITVNGSKISGNTFTVVSGDNNMTIDGIKEKEPAVGGGLTLVEILLIVLVILIIIMAIIIVIRLNRS